MQDLVAPNRKRVGEFLHGRKEGAEFLRMMFDVAGFLSQFGNDIQHLFINGSVPAMLEVELITEDQAQAGIRSFSWSFHPLNYGISGVSDQR